MNAAMLGLDLILAEAGALLFLITRPVPAPKPAAVQAVAIPEDALADTVIITRIIRPPNVRRSERDQIRDYFAAQAWAVVNERRWPHLASQWQDAGWAVTG